MWLTGGYLTVNDDLKQSPCNTSQSCNTSIRISQQFVNKYLFRAQRIYKTLKHKVPSAASFLSVKQGLTSQTAKT